MLHELETGDQVISVRQVGKTVVAIASDSLREGEDQWSRSDCNEKRRYSTGAIADVFVGELVATVIPKQDRIA